MSLQAWCEHNAGTAQRYVPCGTDVIEFEPVEFTGIEVREHVSREEFEREWQRLVTP